MDEFDMDQLAELAEALEGIVLPGAGRARLKSVGAGTPMAFRRSYALSLVAQGYAHADVAYACGVHRSTVTGWAGAAGLKRYPRTGGARLIPERQARTEARSKRDVEIFQMLGEGLRVRQIADRLGVSYSTVAGRLRRIREAEGNASGRARTALAARREAIAAEYRGGASVAEIADARRDSFYRIYNVLYRLGLVGRTNNGDA